MTPQKVCLLIFTDGRRECLLRTLKSFEANLLGDFHSVIMSNDFPNDEYRAWLRQNAPTFKGMPITQIDHDTRLGFGGAIADTWPRIPADCDYVFHLEDDFVLLRLLDLQEMVDILEVNDHLVQVALLRQPVNENEKAAGGIWQQRPQDYTQKYGWMIPSGEGFFAKLCWFEHRIVFTTNPCLYRRSITGRGWTNEEHSEGMFGWRLFQSDANLRSAFFGRMGDPPLVEHIGHNRVGTGY